MSLQNFDVAGKRVFLRCDLNVPLKNGEITDDGRIRASLPTIKTLIAKGASIVIAAHLGRPKGEAKPEGPKLKGGPDDLHPATSKMACTKPSGSSS